jgi:hypothetical protein
MNPIPTQPAPWWRHGHVWLVVSGPALVVVASIITVFLAVKYPDAVLVTQPSVRQPVRERALSPALEGRNHAATPDKSPRP